MISFVVPAFNEAAFIGRTVRQLRFAGERSGRPFEIVVADDGSTDATAAIAAREGARVVPVRKRQIAAVRNAGARGARGDVLVFVDADTLVPASVLRAALAHLESGGAGGGARVRFDRDAPRTLRAAAGAFLWLWNRCGCAAGCFLYATRKAFEAAGGWDERYFATEELFLSMALRRQGPFRVVRPHVLTSARKLTRDRLRSHLALLSRFATGGGFAVARCRDGLDLWYRERITGCRVGGRLPRTPPRRGGYRRRGPGR
ncbi:MAG: glycosyltransferase [Planctomycetes bacterium]|nr:glycosyltransferase [Planctomycetota bacterium]